MRGPTEEVLVHGELAATSAGAHRAAPRCVPSRLRLHECSVSRRTVLTSCKENLPVAEEFGAGVLGVSRPGRHRGDRAPPLASGF